jgi:enamine deaminase RidA (YjgF/YER057c/UK114 family)
MHIFEENIKRLGLIIPEPASAVANYIPSKIIENIMYISGQAPVKNGEIVYKGKIGDKLSVEEGIKAAELCCINIIAHLKKSIDNDWDKLDSFIKLGGFVNCNHDFIDQPKIINGASDLLVNIFGDKGRHTRFAVGSNSLPLDIAVEIEAVIKLK